MEQSKIEIIYQIIISGLPLTTQGLNEYGFTCTEIKYLIDQNILKQAESKKYELVSIRGLYNYGVKLYLLRNLKVAHQCFFKCYELDKLNKDVILQLMLMEVRLGQISKAFELFPHLEQISEEKDAYDNNLYLYLFNLLTRCPEEYAERIKSLDYDSCLFPTFSQMPFKEEQNYIRQSIIKNKTKNALRLQNNLIAQKIKYSVSDELLKEFIVRLVNLESRFKSQLLEFAKNKDYRAIIAFLNTKAKKRYLTNPETFARLIIEAMINISETNIVPKSTVDNTNSLYAAIRGNNFALALKLETATLRRFKQEPHENIVYILLSQINELIYEIEQQSVEPSEKSEGFTKILK